MMPRSPNFKYLGLRELASPTRRCWSAWRLLGAATIACAASGKVAELKWDALPPLPPAAGQQVQPGLASPFAGVDHDALLVAGGANFPERPPWQGGAKAWWADIFVLEQLSTAQPRWVRDKTFKLPRPIAYGASVSTAQGVVCIGGSDATQCYADVFLLAWDPVAREVRRTILPPLPQPLAFMAAACVGTTVYVAGGQHAMQGATPSSAFWSLDLSQRSAARFAWLRLPAWPGPPRVLPVAAAQRTSRGDTFFLFSGRVPHPGAATDLLVDAYAFDAVARGWQTLPRVGGERGLPAMAGTAVATRGGEILLFGGDRGELFRELEAHDLAVEAARKEIATAPAARREALERDVAKHLRAKEEIYARHPGFSREVLGFDPRTQAWRTVARAPKPLPVTTTAVPYGNTILIPSGEIRPGIRTAEVIRVTVIEE